MEKWSDMEIQFLIENYKKYTSKELGNIIGRTSNAVLTKLKRLNLKYDKKYYYNQSFFEHIDTEEKAYWLGFLYADGYVINKRESRNYEVGIQLKASDYLHLMKFNKSLNGNVQITFKDRERWGKIHRICEIRIYCKQMVNDLIQHGCIPNKTFDINMPIIPDELVRHFVRGFFDGDGSVFKKKRCYGLYTNITSASLSFLNQLRQVLNNKNINTYIDEDRNHYKMFTSGKDSSYAFLQYIYEDCNIYLTRKKELYETYKQQLINKLPH